MANERLVGGPFMDDVDRNGDWIEGSGKKAAEAEAARLREFLRDSGHARSGGVRVRQIRRHVWGVYGGAH